MFQHKAPDIVGGAIPGEDGSPRYEIQYKLGAGGQAWVFKALDTRLGRMVAIKVLRPAWDEEAQEYNYSGKYVARFEGEAQKTAALSCQQTITVWEYGKTLIEGFEYMILVMEYVAGLDLHRYITQQGALSIQDTGFVLKQVANSLAEAHARNFIHRDLKSANIMTVSPNDLSEGIKVLDFGISKAFVKGSEFDFNLTQQGENHLSPTFSAPEQVMVGAGMKVVLGPYTDLYALGVIAYHCLVGKHPYQHLAGHADPVGEVLGMVMSPENLRLPEAFDGHPFAGIVHKLLEKKISRRYQDCQELLYDLGNLETTENRHSRQSAFRAPSREELASEPTHRLEGAEPTERLPMGPTAKLAGFASTLLEQPHATIRQPEFAESVAEREFDSTRAIRSGTFDPLEDKKTSAFLAPTPEAIKDAQLEAARREHRVNEEGFEEGVAPFESSTAPASSKVSYPLDPPTEQDVREEPRVVPTQPLLGEPPANNGPMKAAAITLVLACLAVVGVLASGVLDSNAPATSSAPELGASAASSTPAVTSPPPASATAEAGDTKAAPVELSPPTSDVAPLEKGDPSGSTASPAPVESGSPESALKAPQAKKTDKKPKLRRPSTSRKPVEKREVAKKVTPKAKDDTPPKAEVKKKPEVAKKPEPTTKPEPVKPAKVEKPEKTTEEKSEFFGVD